MSDHNDFLITPLCYTPPKENWKILNHYMWKKKHIFIVIFPLQVRQQRRNMWATMTLWSKSRHQREGQACWRCFVSCPPCPIGNIKEIQTIFMSMLLYCPLTPRNPRNHPEAPGTLELQNNTVTMGGFWVLELSFQPEDSVCFFSWLRWNGKALRNILRKSRGTFLMGAK